mgnify:FL=1
MVKIEHTDACKSAEKNTQRMSINFYPDTYGISLASW